MKNQYVTISESLRKLIREKRHESRCLDILHYSVGKLRRGIPTRLLAEQYIGDFFTFREKKGQISYMPRGREQELTEDGKWSLKGRQSTSPGKWIRSMIHPRVIRLLRIQDHEFAALATFVKAEELAAEIHCEFVTFEDGYKSSNYENAPDSCMFGSPVGDFYRCFGAKLLACANGSGVYRGRAVVWFDVESGSGKITFMDRIYSDSPEVEECMKRYAREQGWWHKQRQARDSMVGVVSPEGEHRSMDMNITAGDIAVEFYPYLDTFSSGDGRTLYNDEEHEYTYRDTGGSRGHGDDDDDDYVTTRNGDRIPISDAQEVNGVWYHQDSDLIVYSEWESEYILIEDAQEVDGSWYDVDGDGIKWSAPENQWIRTRNAAYIEGEWYSEDSDDIVKIDGDLCLKENCAEVRGKWYNQDDEDIVFSEKHQEWFLRADCVEVMDDWYPTDSVYIHQNEFGEWHLIAYYDPQQLILIDATIREVA